VRPLATTLAFAGALLLPATAASADPIDGPPALLRELIEELTDNDPGDLLCVYQNVSTQYPPKLVCVPAPDDVAIPIDPS
jgi:hypothetical protein